MAPVPRIAVPVFVMRLGDEGSLSITSEARSAGGGFEAIVRLEERQVSPFSQKAR